MAISGYILKNKDEYILEKTREQVKIIADKMNMHISENSPCIEEGKISYIQYGIYDDVAWNLDNEDWGNDDVEQGESLSFYIYAIDEKYEDDNTFDWIEKGKNLHKVIYIDNMEFKEELTLRFIYEYLKQNPNNYFWNDNKWFYTLKDIEKFIKLPFEENWGYRNPNQKTMI